MITESRRSEIAGLLIYVCLHLNFNVTSCAPSTCKNGFFVSFSLHVKIYIFSKKP